jgi:hypothetical protein
MMSEPHALGWQTGRFALDCFAPDPDGALTSVAVWEAYQAWCRREALVPMAEALFAEAFAALAEDVGIPLRRVGGNESYHQVALIAREATDVDG